MGIDDDIYSKQPRTEVLHYTLKWLILWFSYKSSSVIEDGTEIRDARRYFFKSGLRITEVIERDWMCSLSNIIKGWASASWSWLHHNISHHYITIPFLIREKDAAYYIRCPTNSLSRIIILKGIKKSTGGNHRVTLLKRLFGGSSSSYI